MEFKELRSGEALPRPPAGEEDAFGPGGTNRLIVLRKGFFETDPCFYDVLRWRNETWEPVVEFSNAPVLAYAFLRPDKILEGVRARGQVSAAEFNLAFYANTPEEQRIRADERTKAQQEIADWHAGMFGGESWTTQDIRLGRYRGEAKTGGDRGTAGQPGPREEAWAEEVAHGLAESAVADNEGLRPCPFCGGTDLRHLADSQSDWLRRVKCQICTAFAPPEEGVATWNTRPIEDRLRAELFDAQKGCRALEQDHADAMALVMALEGRIEIMQEGHARDIEHWQGRVAELIDMRDEAEKATEHERICKEHWQRAAENMDKAYQSADKRCREMEGKWASAVEAQGMAYEGGRQEILATSPYLDLRELRDFIFEAWGKEGEKTLDTLRRVKEGREELKKWWRVKEEAQTIAKEMEGEVTGRQYDFMEIDGVRIESSDLPTWAREDDPGDLLWARHMVCALVRWSLNLEGANSLPVQSIRQGLNGLLANIEFLAKKEAEK